MQCQERNLRGTATNQNYALHGLADAWLPRRAPLRFGGSFPHAALGV